MRITSCYTIGDDTLGKDKVEYKVAAIREESMSDGKMNVVKTRAVQQDGRTGVTKTYAKQNPAPTEKRPGIIDVCSRFQE